MSTKPISAIAARPDRKSGWPRDDEGASYLPEIPMKSLLSRVSIRFAFLALPLFLLCAACGTC